MTKKKKWSIIATALSAVVCVALCLLLWWQMTKPERIELPIPQLKWGMTAAEVEAVLADAGIENAKVTGIFTSLIPESTDVYGSMKLSAEDLQKLGVTKVLGLNISTRQSYGALLRFAGSTEASSPVRAGDGSLRLAQAEIWVEVVEGASFKVEKELTDILNKTYGKESLPGRWIVVADELKGLVINGQSVEYMFSPEIRFNQKDCNIGEAVLVYEAAGYVQYLHGGRFSIPPSWQ